MALEAFAVQFSFALQLWSVLRNTFECKRFRNAKIFFNFASTEPTAVCDDENQFELQSRARSSLSLNMPIRRKPWGLFGFFFAQLKGNLLRHFSFILNLISVCHIWKQGCEVYLLRTRLTSNWKVLYPAGLKLLSYNIIRKPFQTQCNSMPVESICKLISCNAICTFLHVLTNVVQYSKLIHGE